MGFSLRLNLWYTGFFVVGALVLFGLAYVLLRSELRQSDREVVSSKLEACRAAYMTGGSAGCSATIAQGKATGSGRPPSSSCSARRKS